MPNTAHFWTEEEEQAAGEMDWAEFSARYPDITQNAYRLRRGKLQREGSQIVTRELIQVPAMPVGQGPEDFVGFSVGYFDVETTYSSQPRVLYAATADAWGQVTRFRLDDPQYAGRDWLDDSVLADAYTRHLEQFDILISWNGKLFDIPVLNGRLDFHRAMRARGMEYRPGLDLRPANPHMHVDLMYKATGQHVRIGRKSLESVSDFFESPNRKTKLSVRIWDRADHGSAEDYQLIADHCDADVLVLRDVFSYLKPHVRNIHRAS